jgi:hypothetical protein
MSVSKTILSTAKTLAATPVNPLAHQTIHAHVGVSGYALTLRAALA